MGSIIKDGGITGTRIASLLDVRPHTGEIYWKVGRRVKAGQRAGVVKRGAAGSGGGYRIIVIDQRQYRAHHLVWASCTGKWPDGEIDHVNGNRDDNRIENLRPATARQNRANKRMQRNNTSGFKWVSWCNQRNTWKAEIREPSGTGRKMLFYCSHDNPRVAYEAACKAAKKIYGAFYSPGLE